VLPCAFGVSIDALRAALERHRPRLVLSLGQAAGREGFTLERAALNVDDARIADNAGARPVDTPVVDGAAPARFSTLPIKAMVAALREGGFTAEVSNSAGTFVCNHVFFALQHLLRRRRSVRSGFMHLPLLPEQLAAGDARPCLSLSAMVDGTCVALATALATRVDLRIAEGALD
jgi:pyroglutamyl-peptidase